MFVKSNNKEKNTNGDTNGASDGDSSSNVAEETVSYPSDNTTTPQGM